jgi:hypothetical protein
MTSDAGVAEVHWPHDLGDLLAELDFDEPDHALLDERFCADLVRHTDAVSTEFAELRAEIRARLCRPPYFTVVRGLTFGDSDALFRVLAVHLGLPVQPYPNPEHRVVRELRPGDASHSPRWGVLTEWLHTDSTNWQRPNDVTMMLCRRPDHHGAGNSLILPADDAAVTVEEALGAHALRRLYAEPLNWPVADELGGGAARQPVFGEHGIRWQLYRIDDAPATLRCPETTMDFLREVDRVLLDSPRLREFPLSANDLLIINNRMTLHARRPIPDAAGSRRVLVHCKVNHVAPGLIPETWDVRR